eukprot:sb/3471067/
MLICLVFLVILSTFYANPVLVKMTSPGPSERLSKDAWTDKAAGERVSNEVIASVERVIGDTKQFLKKVAVVESNLGRAPGTFRAGYYGGIFQVDRIGFKSTQDTRAHPALKAKMVKIKLAYGIDWMAADWKDARKPIYSAIASRLFISNIPLQIPSSLQGQAEYWKKYYNSAAGAGTAQDFIDRWNAYIHG